MNTCVTHTHTHTHTRITIPNLCSASGLCCRTYASVRMQGVYRAQKRDQRLCVCVCVCVCPQVLALREAGVLTAMQPIGIIGAYTHTHTHTYTHTHTKAVWRENCVHMGSEHRAGVTAAACACFTLCVDVCAHVCVCVYVCGLTCSHAPQSRSAHCHCECDLPSTHTHTHTHTRTHTHTEANTSCAERHHL